MIEVGFVTLVSVFFALMVLCLLSVPLGIADPLFCNTKGGKYNLGSKKGNMHVLVT